MIPKIIHYCWFGGRKKNRTIKKCMKTRSSKLSDYKIIERNENNYDIGKAPIYVREAYSQKKFAFVSDYVRLDVLSNYGGIYLDTDVKVLKNFDFILKENLVLCFETNIVMTAFIASSKGNKIIEEFKSSYNSMVFKKDAKVGFIPNTFLLTDFLEENFGLIKNGLTQFNKDYNYYVYNNEFFCGYDLKHNHTKITRNTFTVHLYENSWGGSFKEKIKKLMPSLIGHHLYDKVFDYYKLKKPKADKWEDFHYENK